MLGFSGACRCRLNGKGLAGVERRLSSGLSVCSAFAEDGDLVLSVNMWRLITTCVCGCNGLDVPLWSLWDLHTCGAHTRACVAHAHTHGTRSHLYTCGIHSYLHTRGTHTCACVA